MLLQNKDVRVHIIGGKALIPGGPAVEVDAEYANHPIVKEYIKSGQLIKTEEESAESTAGDIADIWDGMTVKELREYAASNSIDLGETTKKADIIALITATESGSVK